MKKQVFFIALGVMLLLIPGALWAGHQPGVSPDTPAILVSLGQANAIPLDDSAAAAVRGQAQYVLVQTLLNIFDSGPGVQWTWNPLRYRYGNWGGYNYTNNGPPVDQMDYFFMLHDGGESNAALFVQLQSLPNTTQNPWGAIYDPSFPSTTQLGPMGHPAGQPYTVYVRGYSLVGGGLFSTSTPMVYAEYSRREAVYGVAVLNFASGLFR
jgi:hypothetical protein